MLHIFARISLFLLVVFTGIGPLVSHEWSWTEYTSDELYIIDRQEVDQYPGTFYVISADGSGREWKLAWNDGALTTVNCSPDGRILAFVTDSSRLYVIDRSGVIFERPVDRTDDDIYVTNDATVVYLMELIVNARESHPITAPEDREYDSPAVSTSGMMLWTRPPNDVVVTSAEGDTTWILGLSGHPIWLATDDIFAFVYPYPTSYGWHQYLADTANHTITRLPFDTTEGIFSPDGTKRTFSRFVAESGSRQLFLSNTFSGNDLEQISYENYNHVPLCFLAFRPQILLADNP